MPTPFKLNRKNLFLNHKSSSGGTFTPEDLTALTHWFETDDWSNDVTFQVGVGTDILSWNDRGGSIVMSQDEGQTDVPTALTNVFADGSINGVYSNDDEKLMLVGGNMLDDNTKDRLLCWVGMPYLPTVGLSKVSANQPLISETRSKSTP